MILPIFKTLLLVMLIVTAVAVLFIKKPLVAVVVFMSYSSIMAIVWVMLESPDLAITEAAVGAGITSVLFFLTLRRIHQIDVESNSVNKKNEGCEEKTNEE